MNTLRDPIGPERKAVYVRRRLAVLAGILALIAFIVLIIVKPGSSGGAASAPEVELPGEVVVQETAQPAAEVPMCPAGSLAVTALTDNDNYGPEELPQLSLRVENTGDIACQAELGTAGMSFRITSGSDEVWRSTDCQADADRRAVILDPGKPLETETIAWDRTRSGTETCNVPRDPVSADGATYHLHVSAAGVQSNGTASFLLY